MNYLQEFSSDLMNENNGLTSEMKIIIGENKNNLKQLEDELIKAYKLLNKNIKLKKKIDYGSNEFI